MPILKVLFAMEECGAAIDEDALRNLSADFSKRIEKTEEKIYELSGGNPFNIASPKQLAEVLYDDLGLKVLKKTATVGLRYGIWCLTNMKTCPTAAASR